MTKIQDASVLKIVETVDGQEIDITPAPPKPPETPVAPRKQGGKS